MALNFVSLGFEYYPDPTKGRPVFNGQIFVGIPGLDPEILANQKQVTLREEDGTEVQVSQPVLTGAGGVPVRNGSPVQILVDGNYSLKVLNSIGSQVYNLEDAFNGAVITTATEVFAILFDTVADMVSGTLPDGGSVALAVGQTARTKGYNAIGDGGDNIYEIVAAATGVDDGFRFIDITTHQAQALFPGGIHSVRQAGATGDGVTSDIAAIQKAIDSALDIFFPGGTYLCNTAPAFSQSAIYTGAGFSETKIQLADGLTIVVSVADVNLKGINFSANDLSVNIVLIDVISGADRFTMDSCRIGDTATLVETSNQIGLRIDAQDVDQYLIKDCLFEDISCMGDVSGAPVGNGFATGFFLQGSEANEAAYTAPSKGHIYDSRFINIFTEKNPGNAGALDSDADAIRISIAGGITPATTKQWGLHIENCYFKSVQKSAVKCGGMTNLTIKNTEVLADRTDIDMIAAHRIQWGSGVHIEGTTCVGSFTNLFNLVGQDITVGGTNYAPGNGGEITAYCVLFQTESGFENRNISVHDLRATECLGLINLTDPASVGSTGQTLSFSDMHADRLLVSSSSAPVIDLKKCEDVTLENINVFDGSGNADTCLAINDYTGLSISGCHFEAKESIIKQTDNSVTYPNLEITDTVCKWTDTGNIATPLITLVATTGTAQVLAGVRIDGLTIIARSTTARIENAFSIKATDFSIKDISVYCPNTLAVTSAAFVEAVEVIDSSKGIIDGVTYNTDVPVAGAGTSWAVNVENSASITVWNVVSDNSGVVLRTGTTSTLVNQVNASASKTAVDDQPTTNTVGTDVNNLMP